MRLDLNAVGFSDGCYPWSSNNKPVQSRMGISKFSLDANPPDPLYFYHHKHSLHILYERQFVVRSTSSVSISILPDHAMRQFNMTVHIF